MGLARSLIFLLWATPAFAAPLTLSLSAEGGIVGASPLGAARDDFQLTLRGGIAVGRRFAITLGVNGDLERLELGLRLGGLFRPFVGGRLSPYLRAEAALLAATHFGDDWELALGVGLLWRCSRYLALFAEVDLAGRIGAVKSLSDHVSLGIAVTAPSFWR